jgi:COP9 signalosome complex subunit 4
LISQKLVTFEEQVQAVREILADALEAEEQWTEAARVLQGIPLHSGHRALTDAYRLKVYIRITRLLLEDDDAIEAEVYLNRASLILPPNPPQFPGGENPPKETEEELETRLSFRLCQARILDYKRRFLEASWRYLELSYAREMHADDRQRALYPLS